MSFTFIVKLSVTGMISISLSSAVFNVTVTVCVDTWLLSNVLAEGFLLYPEIMLSVTGICIVLVAPLAYSFTYVTPVKSPAVNSLS